MNRNKLIAIAMLSVTVCCMADAAWNDDFAMNYDELTLAALPPASDFVERALAAMPYSEDAVRAWERRMRLAALVPSQLQLGWFVNERSVPEFGMINQRGETRDWGGSSTVSETVTRDLERRQGGGAQNVVWSDSRTITRDERNTSQPWREVREQESWQRTGSSLEWFHRFRLQMAWNLEELVYHGQEWLVLDTQVSSAQQRRRLTDEVVDHYVALRRTLVNLERRPNDPELQSDRLLYASFLDAITDYYISEYANQVMGLE